MRQHRTADPRISIVILLAALVTVGIVRAESPFAPPLTVPSRAFIADIVDIDADGILDLVGVNTFAQRASLLYGNGDGTFAPEVFLDLPVSPSHARAGDLDQDGQLDLVFSSWGGPEIAVLWGTGPGTFLPPEIVPVASGSQHRIALADLNGDDRLDIVVSNRVSTLDVLLNAGERTFEPVRSFPPGTNRPFGIAVADMNGDNIPDLVLGTAFADSLVAVLRGLGDGTFDAPRTENVGNAPVNAVPADVDGDGVLDIVAAGVFGLAGFPRGLALLRQTTTGDFRTQHLQTINDPWGVAVADLNGDGIPDLATAGFFFGVTAGVEVLWGSGTGTFVPAGIVGPGFGEVYANDLDGDGRADLLVSPWLFSNATSFVLLNKILTSGECTDLDGDGYGAPGNSACIGGAAPDCDDHDPTISPGAPEACDAVDNDCDGRVDEDFDVDADGVTTCQGDCDDRSAKVLPGAPEICNGLDDDCNGQVDDDIAATASCDDHFACTVDVCVQGECVHELDACQANADSRDLFAHPVALEVSTFRFVDAAVADLTGDGRLDLVEVADGVSFVPGLGVDGFGSSRTVATVESSGGLAVADLDGDGDTDLAVTDRLNSTVAIFLNQGDGRFVPGVNIPLDVRPGRIQAADIDADGRIDLAVELPMAWAWQVLRNVGEALFEPAMALPGRQMNLQEIEDFTRDGLPDVILAGAFAARFFINEGGFAFAPPVNLVTGGVSAIESGDLDGDHRRDLALVTGDAVLTFLGDGTGGFESLRSPVELDFVHAATLVDLNGDRRPDLLATRHEELVRSTGSGDGLFEEAVAVGSGGGHLWVARLDVDTKGCSEVAFTGFAGAGVLRADGRGGLVSPLRLEVDGNIEDLAVADMDGSGTDDIVVLFSDQVQLFLGEGEGTFRRMPPTPIAAGARRLFLSNVDGNEMFPDLLVLHGKPGANEVTVHLGSGADGFSRSSRLTTGRPLFTLAAGDVNADGLTDIIVANDDDNPNNGSVSTFLGQGDGRFLPALESDARVPIGFLVLGEYTGDDHVDVLTVRRLTGSPRNAHILRGSGHGRFDGWVEPFFDLGSGRFSDSFQRLAAVDINRDGMLDVVRAASDGVQVALGQATGGLAPQIEIPSVADEPERGLAAGTPTEGTLAVTDVNGDGHDDVLTLNRGGSLVVFPGRGDGSLEPPVGFLAGRPGSTREPLALATGDLNGDGRIDAVVAGRRRRSLVLLINGASGSQPSRLPEQARGRECPPGLAGLGGPPGRGVPDDVIRIPCRVAPPPCER